MEVIFFIILFLIVWLAPIIWALKTKHEQKAVIIFVVLLLGVFGYFISLLILSHKPPHKATSGEPDVYECTYCNTLYRLSDYLDDVDIFCGECKKPIVRPCNMDT